MLTSDKRHLLLFPNEILVEIFTQLSSLLDAMALAASCRHLRTICTEHAKRISNTLVERTLPFHHNARKFLTAGGGPQAEERLSLLHLATLTRNWSIVEQDTDKFELQMHHAAQVGILNYPRLRNFFCELRKLPVQERSKHKRYLKRRRRLTRLLLDDFARGRIMQTFYVIRSFLTLDRDKWGARMADLSGMELSYARCVCGLVARYVPIRHEELITFTSWNVRIMLRHLQDAIDVYVSSGYVSGPDRIKTRQLFQNLWFMAPMFISGTCTSYYYLIQLWGACSPSSKEYQDHYGRQF